MNKKYYWLKLKNDFFNREEIIIVEAMQNGKEYIIFYLKLLLKSIESDGKLLFRNTLPYSVEMLATITKTNIDTVKIAIEIFLDLGMMEKWDDGTIFMKETQNMVGSETKWAGYKRIERKEIGQSPKKSKNSPIEIERDIRSLSNVEKYIGGEYTEDQKSYIIEEINNVDKVNVEIYAVDMSTGQKVNATMKLVDFEKALEGHNAENF